MTDPSTTSILPVIIASVGIPVGILQAVIILVLNGIRSDIKEIWARMYDHYHEVHCDHVDCASLRTGNVIIPGAKR